MPVSGFLNYVTCIMILLLSACVSNEKESLDFEADQHFFPLQVGKFREYQVDSILYRQGRFLDSVKTLVREEITTSYQDTIGVLFTILRSIRKSSKDPWTPSATYTARIFQNKVIQNQANLNFISLVFPILKNSSWDGLALIQTDQTFNVNGESMEIYQNWDPFRINDNIKAEKIGTQSFNEVVTILQSDEEDILAKRFSLEKYAKGVGLIYKEMTILDCNNTINQCSNSVPWSNRATKGFILRQSIVQFN